METIKSSALVFIAIVACLMLLLTPDPERNERQISDRITANQDLASFKQQDIPARIEQVQSLTQEQDEFLSAEQGIPAAPAATTPTVAVEDWPLVLYPELARIVDLENLPADMAMGELLPMLSASDPVIRLAALESLAEMSHPARSSMLAAALDDPLPQIRIAALEALATPDDAEAWTYIEPYLFDEDAEVRVAAIEALAVMENEQAIHSLAGLLSDRERLIRHHAVNALGEIGGETAIMYLLQARYDPNATIRANADAILAELEYITAY